MNWDNQLSSNLSAADGSVAKMRERLTSVGKFSSGREDLFPWKEMIHESDLDPPTLPVPLARAALPLQPSSSLSPAVQWADLAAIQSQLQMQSQAIESLTQKLQDVEKERRSQQCHIHSLQEEIRRLREESKERDEARRRQCPGAEGGMEQWRREVGRELSSLRGHITRAALLGNVEESFSSKLCREELEQLRIDVDQLKTRLRRQEEDVLLQQSESRRQYERSCKSLEELTDSHRAHRFDLAKTVSQYTHTQQELQQIRATVSGLKDEVRNRMLQERQCTPLLSTYTSAPAPAPVPRSHSRGIRAEKAELDSDSEDSSLTPSLAEVSSDDLSWPDDKDEAALYQKGMRRVRLSTKSRCDVAGPGSDLEEEDDDDDGDEDDEDEQDDDLLDDDDVDLGLEPALELNDL
ncbi:general vesicular transport factor p115 [Myripristis murdjan]|uniref:General vesicular transport factor p115-like n=1 Tax=Myripristis murdjan TaxID=586833 RepID=A0A667XTY1_9TELE|nr:general vesicular transport factor p115-like [Myripristis murdjan]XP_029906093.1 general vesicular transport factor p115-like [Myripristis murdjan]